MHSKFIFLASVAVAGLVSASGVYAQSTGSAAPAGVAVIDEQAAPVNSDEIIVTARRRAEGIQRVPASITAFGALQLSERNIRTEEDLQAATPGLVLRQTQGQNSLNYSIRGQTVDAFTGSAASVVPYVNDVQLNAGGATSFFDLEAVQVLKGPQGTLFGRNATGGAVLYSTAKPSDEYEGYAQVSIGNYDLRAAQAMVNLAFSDKIMVRLAGDLTSRDGYMTNDFYGTKVGSQRTRVGRISVTLKPTETLANTFVFQAGHGGGTNTGQKPLSIYTRGQVGPDGTPLVTTATDIYSPAGLGAGWAAYIAANPGILRSQPDALQTGLPGYLASRRNRPFWSFASDDGSRHHDDHFFATNTTTWDVSDMLTVKNIFGYSFAHSLDNTPQLGIPYGAQYTSNLNLNQFGNDVETRSYSNELQLQGKTDNLTYIFGGYYQKTKQHIFYPQTYYNIAPLPGINGPFGFGNTSDYMNGDKNLAVFAQGTYDLTSAGLAGLSITAGARYSWETVTLQHLSGSTNRNGEFQKRKFDKPSWEFGLEYQANPQLLTYIKTRGSWRTGGLNGNAAPIDAPAAENGDYFEPETVKDIEAGAKYSGRIMGRPMHFNIAVYKMWIDNIQRFLTANTTVDGVTYSLAVTANVPSAGVQGIELDGSFTLADWLTVGGSGAYTDAKFKDNTALIFGVPFVFGPYPDTPKLSGQLFAQLKFPLANDAGQLGLRGDIYMQKSQYFSANAGSSMPGSKLPGYKLVNLRAEWRNAMNSGVTVSGFARNLLNEKYYVGGLAEGASFGINSAAVGRPRMYGLEVRVDF